MFVPGGGRSVLKGLQSSFGGSEIELGTQLSKCVNRAPKMFGGAIGLADGVGAAKLVMSARRPIAIAEQIKNGNTPAKVLGRQVCFGSGHLNQAVGALGLARQQKV